MENKLAFLSLVFILLLGCSNLFAQKITKEEVNKLFDEVEVLLEEEKYNIAISSYENTLLKEIHITDENRILSELGYVYASLGDGDKSLTYFNKALIQALKHTPDSILFYYSL